MQSGMQSRVIASVDGLAAIENIDDDSRRSFEIAVIECKTRHN